MKNVKVFKLAIHHHTADNVFDEAILRPSASTTAVLLTSHQVLLSDRELP